MIQKNIIAFKKINRLTLVSVYFLVLVGSIVRSTGAGMGCPDWPKCFGQYIPPTSENQLPEDYEKLITENRIKKNAKLNMVLSFFGVNGLISKEHDLNESIPYNPIKAWIEYLNRLVGVVIGLLIFLTMLKAFKIRRSHEKVFRLSVFAFILVGLQGFLGSLVVSTNLLPGMITVHMLLALLLVYILILMGVKVQEDPKKVNIKIKKGLTLSVLIIVFIQLILGTKVREDVDFLLNTLGVSNEELFGSIGDYFYIHRAFSWFVLVLVVFYATRLYKNESTRKWGLATLAMVGLSFLSGVILFKMNLPALAQPIHLGIATILIGLLITLWLNSNRVNTRRTNS